MPRILRDDIFDFSKWEPSDPSSDRICLGCFLQLYTANHRIRTLNTSAVRRNRLSLSLGRFGIFGEEPEVFGLWL